MFDALTLVEWDTFTSMIERALTVVMDIPTHDELLALHGDLVSEGHLFCCQWVEYPAPGRNTECPSCHSVFAVTDVSDTGWLSGSCQSDGVLVGLPD